MGVNRAIVLSCDDGAGGGLLLGREAPTWAGLELADKTAAGGVCVLQVNTRVNHSQRSMNTTAAQGGRPGRIIHNVEIVEV